MVNYDVIIMVTPDKIPLLKITYPYLKSNLGAKEIYFVANKSVEDDIKKYWDGKVHFLNEESILEGLNIAAIRAILQKRCGDGRRAGWFYQQFLKMAYSKMCTNHYYLLWDSDTVPLKKINYFNNDMKPCFITKREYYKDYFDTIAKLFEGKVGRLEKDTSYIAENMMINKKLMLEIIKGIEDNASFEGNTFYEKIMNAIELSALPYTGFSEFETYGNYVDTLHPGTYGRLKLKTQRLGSFLFGHEPNEEQLEWASKDYDIISFEMHGKQWLKKMTMSSYVREHISAKKLFTIFISISNFFDFIRRRPIAKID